MFVTGSTYSRASMIREVRWGQKETFLPLSSEAEQLERGDILWVLQEELVSLRLVQQLLFTELIICCFMCTNILSTENMDWPDFKVRIMPVAGSLHDSNWQAPVGGTWKQADLPTVLLFGKTHNQELQRYFFGICGFVSWEHTVLNKSRSNCFKRHCPPFRSCLAV